MTKPKKRGLYANINARKRKGISRPKSKSTISKEAYANMKAGFPKKRKEKMSLIKKLFVKFLILNSVSAKNNMALEVELEKRN